MDIMFPIDIHKNHICFSMSKATMQQKHAKICSAARKVTACTYPESRLINIEPSNLVTHDALAGASACSGSPCSPGSYGRAGKGEARAHTHEHARKQTDRQTDTKTQVGFTRAVGVTGQGRRGRRTRSACHALPDLSPTPQVGTPFSAVLIVDARLCLL